MRAHASRAAKSSSCLLLTHIIFLSQRLLGKGRRGSHGNVWSFAAIKQANSNGLCGRFRKGSRPEKVPGMENGNKRIHQAMGWTRTTPRAGTSLRGPGHTARLKVYPVAARI